jgi:two-component system CheB/CheR fusion protein
VLANLMTIRRDVHSRAGKWYDIRLRPYRTVEDKIDGVVVTFIDITDCRRIEQVLNESEQTFLQQKRMMELSRDPIFVWEFD